MSAAAAAEKGRPPSASPAAIASLSSSAHAPSSSSSAELDPLLKDLSEKKQSFRRSVVSLAAELKDVRVRLATQEESFARETRCRQAVEKRAKTMEDEICRLQRSLEEKDGQLQESTSSAEQGICGST